MLNKYLILFGTVFLLLSHAENLLAQEYSAINYFIIKGDKKTYEFERDSSSYKSLSEINPDWIKSIEILRAEQLEGGSKAFLVLTLKRRKFNELPVAMRNKFR